MISIRRFALGQTIKEPIPSILALTTPEIPRSEAEQHDPEPFAHSLGPTLTNGVYFP